MLINYLKVAGKVLLRRKFFTFVSLFGTVLTLLVLMVVSALLDNALSPQSPEVHLDRTLHVSRMMMRGEKSQWNGNPGYGFLDRYCRGLQHVQRMAIDSEPAEALSFVGGEKVVSQLRRTDAEYWKILSFKFIAGHPYDEADVKNGSPVVVITEGAGHRLFGTADPIGRSFEASGQTFQVIGVVPNVSRLRESAFADIWAPVTTFKTDTYRKQLMGDFNGLLLADDASHFGAIRSEFTARMPHVEMMEPAEYNKMEGIPLSRLQRYAGELVGVDDHERPLTSRLVLGIVVLALLFMLLPAINLVNMNISRIFERVSEIGVRKAFGASTAHLVGQFVVENIVLSMAGGAIGLLLSAWLLHLINGSGWIPNAELHLNYRIFLYGFGLSIFFGLLSGVYPAWRMARLDPVDALRGGQR